jgi:DNA-binding NarL/FixJ family response regulator
VIRLVLADDHPVVLEGLVRLFAADPDFEVVALAATGSEALAAVRSLKPDVLVLDLRMPGKDGLAVLREMRRERLKARVVVLTASDSEEVLQAIRLGVEGVVLKEMAPQLLLRSVRVVQAGGKWIERALATRVLDTLLIERAGREALERVLTRRELEVARLTAQGFSNKVVGDKLGIAEGTAKLHLHRVYEKLGVKGRIALARYLRERGLE